MPKNIFCYIITYFLFSLIYVSIVSLNKTFNYCEMNVYIQACTLLCSLSEVFVMVRTFDRKRIFRVLLSALDEFHSVFATAFLLKHLPLCIITVLKLNKLRKLYHCYCELSACEITFSLPRWRYQFTYKCVLRLSVYTQHKRLCGNYFQAQCS